MALTAETAIVRTIKKRSPPASLTEWRALRLAANRSEGMECTYQEMRRHQGVLEAVEAALVAEQGGLCAYTGQRIAIVPPDSATGDPLSDFHIEHLTPQAHCAYGQDADYSNIVACWPRPNCGFEPAYGARKKGSWPSTAEQSLFVSPLRADCSERFAFNRRGEIKPAKAGDTAAEETIRRLGLEDHTLTALRRAAIQGYLGFRPISLAQARRLANHLLSESDMVNRGALVRLTPYCFAIEQALEQEIRKLEAIARER